MGLIPPFRRKFGVFAFRSVSIVVENCGGFERVPILSNNTSYAMPNPARIDVLPLLPGEYAMPIRGAKFVFCVLGSWKSITPGTLDIAFNFCKRSPNGTVVYS